MKKLLFALSLCALVLFPSCNKDNGTDEGGSEGGNGGGKINGVTSISTPGSVALLVGSGETLIPVTLTPEDASFEEYVKVEGGNDAVFTWRIADGGIMVTPVASGSATLTLKAKAGPAEQAELNIQVINGITNFAIYFSDAWAKPYLDLAKICLTVGKQYLLQAKITDSDHNSVYTPVKWKVEGDGIEFVSKGINGEITVKEGGKHAKITATFPVGEGNTATVEVHTYDAPTAIVFSTYSSLEMKKGTSDKRNVNIRVEPASAVQAVTISKPDAISCNQQQTSGTYSTTLQIWASASNKDPYTLTVSSAVSSNVSKDLTLSVVDYLENDVKIGDYIYYNSSTKKFRSSDCGRRLENYSYKDNLKQPDPQSGEVYVGIILKVLDNNNIPTDSWHYLNQYNLAGLSNSPNTHVMVWSKTEVRTAWDASSDYKTQRYQSSWGTDEYGFIITEKLPELTIIDRLAKFPSIGNYSTGTTGWFIPQQSSAFSSYSFLTKAADSFGANGTVDFREKYSSYSYKCYWTPSDDTYGYAHQFKIECKSGNSSWSLETSTGIYGQKNNDSSGSLHVYMLRPAFII